jgi:anti-sigma B factor antagonist
MTMNVAARRFANTLVLHASGRLDQDTCEAFRTDLTGHVDAAVRDRAALILDLSDLEYVSSAGLRCLLIASRQMKAAKGRISVAQMQPMVAEIFEISHFDMLFDVYPTVPEALAAVSADAAAAYTMR